MDLNTHRAVRVMHDPCNHCGFLMTAALSIAESEGREKLTLTAVEHGVIVHAAEAVANLVEVDGEWPR